MDIFIKILIYLLEGIFGIGLVGCCCVLVLATIDDVKVLFHSDKPHQASAPSEAAAPAISPSTLHPQAH